MLQMYSYKAEIGVLHKIHCKMFKTYIFNIVKCLKHFTLYIKTFSDIFYLMHFI